MEGSAIEAQAISLTSSATSDSDTSSLVETWTLVEKDEAEQVRDGFTGCHKKACLEKKVFVWIPFQETTDEPIDEEGKNFDDIKAPVGKYLLSRKSAI